MHMYKGVTKMCMRLGCCLKECLTVCMKQVENDNCIDWFFKENTRSFKETAPSFKEDSLSFKAGAYSFKAHVVSFKDHKHSFTMAGFSLKVTFISCKRR